MYQIPKGAKYPKGAIKNFAIVQENWVLLIFQKSLPRRKFIVRSVSFSFHLFTHLYE